MAINNRSAAIESVFLMSVEEAVEEGLMDDEVEKETDKYDDDE